MKLIYIVVSVLIIYIAGKIKGIQIEIKEINPLATFFPCAAHILNLIELLATKSNEVIGNILQLWEQYLVQAHRVEMGSISTH